MALFFTNCLAKFIFVSKGLIWTIRTQVELLSLSLLLILSALFSKQKPLSRGKQDKLKNYAAQGDKKSCQSSENHNSFDDAPDCRSHWQ